MHNVLTADYLSNFEIIPLRLSSSVRSIVHVTTKGHLTLSAITAYEKDKNQKLSCVF